MRRLVTYLLTLIFIAGFCGFFAVQSLVTYARDTDAVVETAKAANLRETAVTLTAGAIHAQLSSSTKLGKVPKVQLTAAVGQVISDSWVESTVRAAHTSLVAALDGAGQTAEIDLRPTKASLSTAFALLGTSAIKRCAEFLGTGPCSSGPKATAAMAVYTRSVQAAIERIPERVDLLAALQASGQAERVGAFIDVDGLRHRLNELGRLRWLGLAALAVGLVLIALVNWRPAGRTLQATGTALVLAAVAYLILAKVLGWLAPRVIEGAIEPVRAQHQDQGATATVILDGLERMLTELVVRALNMASGVVLVCALGGVLLVVASRFFPRGN
jgi:hypothetical protein